MQRHMQNITFITIVGVLLSCSFIFSQLTNVGTQDAIVTDTPVVREKTMDDLPVCADNMADEEKFSCYADAAEISQDMLDAKVDAILALETESSQRIAILEAQLAWEDARDADCSLTSAMATGEEEKGTVEMICLRDQNLARVEKLDDYLCEWYGATACSNDEANFGSSD